MTTRLAFVAGSFLGAAVGTLLRDLDVLPLGGPPDVGRVIAAGIVYAAATVAAWVVYWHAYDRGAAAHRSRA